MPDQKIDDFTFNVKLLHPLFQVARHQGISIDQLLIDSPFTEKNLDMPGVRYATHHFSDILTRLTRQTKSRQFPFHAAQATQPRMLGCLGFVMTTANTLQDAYHMLADYFSLMYEGMSLNIEHREEHCILTLDIGSASPEVTEFFVGCILNWPRWLIGQQIPAESIHFCYPNTSKQDYRHLLADELHFSQKQCQIIFSNQYMTHHCTEANAEMHLLHCNFADSLLLKSSQHQALIAQTKHQIRQKLLHSQDSNHQPIRREDIADNLNMSLRTFQRKLNLLHSNFQMIHDQVRHETCLQLIAQPEITLSQISFRLRFANPSAFQKAFKRWMKTSPSEYKKRLQSTLSTSSSPSIKSPIKAAQWFQDIPETEILTILAEKLKQISSFSRGLLSWISVLTTTHPDGVLLTHLADVTHNSVARLAIYLWPSQQIGIIDNNSEGGEWEFITFNLNSISEAILKSIPSQEKTIKHFNIAHCASHQWSNTSLAMKHYLQCDPLLINETQYLSILAFAAQHKNVLNEHRSLAPLSELYSLLLKSHYHLNPSHPLPTDLILNQLDTLIKREQVVQAQENIELLQSTELTLEQDYELGLQEAKLFTLKGQPAEVLSTLYRLASQFCGLAPFPSSNNELLLEISIQLDNISQQITQENNHTKQNISNDKNKLQQLDILQLISQHCLDHKQPLLAACAISRMIKLSLTTTEYKYSAFAYSHFAWISSWFIGNNEIAKYCSLRAQYLASQHSEPHLQLCKLILYTRVYHWFSPQRYIIKKFETNSAINEINSAKEINSKTLLQYLLLCTGEKLTTIKSNCEALLTTDNGTHKNSIRHSEADALKRISGLCDAFINVTQEPNKALSKEYRGQLQGFTVLYQAFYQKKYTLWPQLQSWGNLLEQDIPGHFIVIEAVFICTLMQMHCDAQNNQRLNTRKIETNITRLELWSLQSPENFQPQYEIVKAAYFGHSQPLLVAMKQFEKALTTVEKTGHSQHIMLCYDLYAELIKEELPHLSRSCTEKFKSIQRQWTGQ